MIKARVKLIGQSHPIQTEVSIENGTIKMNEKTYSSMDPVFGPPVSGTIYGTLLNYKGNLEALGDAIYEKPYNEPPKAPVLYIKPTNTINTQGRWIPLPADVEQLEVGATLGVVIGKTATRVKEEDACDYIEGYMIVNDVSVPRESFYRPAVKHKSRDGFCPIGPWVVESDAIVDPDALGIRVYVNDELKQENTTVNLIRPIARLLADVTEFMTLHAGDVLLVGVPENAPLVKENDEVRIEIDGIGSLENKIVAEEKWRSIL